MRGSPHSSYSPTVTFDNQLLRSGVTLRDEVFRRRDKVCKRVALLTQPARVVPGLAKFAAAADVRDGKNHAAIQKTYAVRAEIDGDGVTVATVTVE